MEMGGSLLVSPCISAVCCGASKRLGLANLPPISNSMLALNLNAGNQWAPEIHTGAAKESWDIGLCCELVGHEFIFAGHVHIPAVLAKWKAAMMLTVLATCQLAVGTVGKVPRKHLFELSAYTYFFIFPHPARRAKC